MIDRRAKQHDHELLTNIDDNSSETNNLQH